MAKVVGRRGSRALAAVARSTGLLLVLALVAARAFAGNVTLAWDADTSSALSGYMVYYGPAAGSYSAKIDVGKTTTYTVSDLIEGVTYHFATTAYDTSHAESAFSNDVSATVPYSAPVANFSASATSGTAPLAMNFVSSSTGTITSYAWNFGDGTTSTSAAPSHVYLAAGVYTVSLTVTGPGGSNTQTRSNYVTVTAPAPIAQFTGTPTSGASPLTVAFTNSSTGSITSYAWTFGDGGTSTAASPSHIYAANGVYTVSLTVTGPGGSNTQTRSNYVTVGKTSPLKCKRRTCGGPFSGASLHPLPPVGSH